MATQSVPTKSRLADYSHIEQLPDPPKRPDMNEYPSISAFTSAIGVWFRYRDDVLIASAGYLWRLSTDRYGPHPDAILALGVEAPQRVIRRNGYVISEVGKPPDLVLEVGSHSTGRRDYTSKRDTYAEYGVVEYWRFDPTGGEHHDGPVAGDTLVGGKYEPIEIVSESQTRHWGYSETLGLEVWWYDGILRLRDPLTGEFIRTHVESEEAVESERAARESAEERVEFERAARESAEARADEMEAELRRLRGG